MLHRTTRQDQTGNDFRSAVRGLVLDMDGTLFESESLHSEAWKRVFAEIGLQFPDQWYHQWVGVTDERMIRTVTAEYAPAQDPEALLARKMALFPEMASGALCAFPGVRERLERVRDCGLPMVLCTSSRRDDCDLTLRETGLADLLPLRVCINDVTAPKPDPDPYLRAVALLGLEPGQCAAIEDSPSGTTSARAAGCRVIGVATTHEPERLTNAELVFPTTADALDWLLETMEGEKNFSHR